MDSEPTDSQEQSSTNEGTATQPNASDESTSDANKSDGVGQESSGNSWLRFFGPGFLVAAAFIGPGTVKASIKAGGNYGFQLLWAVLFAGLATIIFQGMAARLGLVTRKGLAESLRDYFRNQSLKQGILFLVIAAIIFGNTAYQAGNLSGAAQGLKHFVPFVPAQIWLLICSGLAFFVIWTGTLKTLKVVLTSLVVLMSLTFILAAVQSRPSFPELWAGCFSFEVFDMAVVFALIGTTVVPYNLFLHSSSIAEQNADDDVSHDGQQADLNSNISSNAAPENQPETDDSALDEKLGEALAATKLDTWIAVWTGALITAAIVITAAGTNATTLDEAATAFSDLLGWFGKALFFVGLFAAGLTSAITAPLAAGYVYAGCFGHSAKADGVEVRKVAAIIIGVGYLIAAIFGQSPGQVIFLAQVANGMILPLIAIFLLIVMNDKRLLGKYRNHWQQNILGGLIVAFVVALGLFKIGSELGIFS